MSRVFHVSFVVIVGLGLGCGTRAKISRVSSLPVEGKIVRSDANSIYVATHEGETPIPRSEVTKIDHPGNVAATIGVILSAYGVLNIMTGLPQCEEQGGAFCTGVFLPAAVGVGLMASGFSRWRRSRNAAAGPPAGPGVSVGIAPVATRSENGTFGGAVIMGSF